MIKWKKLKKRRKTKEKLKKTRNKINPLSQKDFEDNNEEKDEIINNNIINDNNKEENEEDDDDMENKLKSLEKIRKERRKRIPDNVFKDKKIPLLCNIKINNKTPIPNSPNLNKSSTFPQIRNEQPPQPIYNQFQFIIIH